MNIWNPIFISKSNNFERKIHEIAKTLYDLDFNKLSDTGLHSGKAGIAHFFFYYSKFSSNSIFSNKGYELVNNIILEQNPDKYSLCAGLSGIAWGLNHLSENEFIFHDENLI